MQFQGYFFLNSILISGESSNIIQNGNEFTAKLENIKFSPAVLKKKLLTSLKPRRIIFLRILRTIFEA